MRRIEGEQVLMRIFIGESDQWQHRPLYTALLELLRSKGLAGATVLKGVAGRVIGPGHNSVVMGPDGQTEYVVYHAWDVGKTGRRMCIDPLRWEHGRPTCDGPSVEAREIVVAQ